MTSRRSNVPFDPFHFESQARQGVRHSLAETFGYIYRNNHWSGAASVSGEGADVIQTAQIRAALPALLRELNIAVLLDLPCGDFGWMQQIELPVTTYIGADIVPELIVQNNERYGRAERRFVVLDVTRDPMPGADLLICRDCLVHLSFADIFRALANLKGSGIRYLLTTTFTECALNEDIVTGDWRVLNLQRAPFFFPAPLRLIDERCSEGGGLFRDKHLGLWAVAALPEIAEA